MKKNIEFGIIIQARTGSKRFPKKSLSKLGNKRLIDWVIDRVKKVKNIKKIVLATTDLKEDKILVKIAKEKKIYYFQGSSQNVLKRFYDTAEHFSIKKIIRVCADNPFISHEFIENLINNFSSNEYDIGFNHIPYKNFKCANGFGAEIFETSLLKKIIKKKISKLQEEHVTKYFWDNHRKFKIKPIPIKKIYKNSKLKYDVDYRKDLNYLNQLLKKSKININTTASEIVKFTEKK